MGTTILNKHMFSVGPPLSVNDVVLGVHSWQCSVCLMQWYRICPSIGEECNAYVDDSVQTNGDTHKRELSLKTGTTTQNKQFSGCYFALTAVVCMYYMQFSYVPSFYIT